MKDLKDHKRFMRLAIAKAHEGVKRGQTPFGACIVSDGKVIATAHNCVWKTTDITAHAEIVAIRAACREIGSIDLSSSIIYSTCEPCPMCFSACHWARIKTIVYGTGILDAKSAGFNELSVSNRTLKRLGKSSVAIVPNFLRDENIKLFKTWQQSKNKKAY